MDFLTQLYYLQSAALEWLHTNPTNLNAANVREALIASRANFVDIFKDDPRKE